MFQHEIIPQQISVSILSIRNINFSFNKANLLFLKSDTYVSSMTPATNRDINFYNCTLA